MRKEALSIFLLVTLFLVLVFPTSILSGVVNSNASSGSLGAQANVDWWPMFHHDSMHTGYSNSTAPNTRNTHIKGFQNGIFVGYSNNNVIIGNDLTANSQNGIWLDSSSNNTVTSNNATANGYGIWLQLSSNNTVNWNNATANIYGVLLDSSFGNIMTGNIIAKNPWGLELFNASNNVIYHNNFIGNNVQAIIYSTSLGNAWDNGYPSGGNYWSDYKGGDLYSGPYQNETGSDGIGDVPYAVDGSNTDNYPLMSSYGTSLLSVTISPGFATLVVGQSQLFTSIVSGGTLPYAYQWYLNAIPVQGATLSSWTFTPTSGGSYAVYVKVGDSVGTLATSNFATAIVGPDNVGGGGGGGGMHCMK